VLAGGLQGWQSSEYRCDSLEFRSAVSKDVVGLCDAMGVSRDGEVKRGADLPCSVNAFVGALAGGPLTAADIGDER
jgi:hypothetical protein